MKTALCPCTLCQTLYLLRGAVFHGLVGNSKSQVCFCRCHVFFSLARIFNPALRLGWRAAWLRTLLASFCLLWSQHVSNCVCSFLLSQQANLPTCCVNWCNLISRPRLLPWSWHLGATLCWLRFKMFWSTYDVDAGIWTLRNFLLRFCSDRCPRTLTWKGYLCYRHWQRYMMLGKCWIVTLRDRGHLELLWACFPQWQCCAGWWKCLEIHCNCFFCGDLEIPGSILLKSCSTLR